MWPERPSVCRCSPAQSRRAGLKPRARAPAPRPRPPRSLAPRAEQLATCACVLLLAAACGHRPAQLPAQPADAASASSCSTSVLLPPLAAAAAAAATANASAAAAPSTAACSCCAQFSHTSTGAVSSCTNLQSRRKQRPFCAGKAAAGRWARRRGVSKATGEHSASLARAPQRARGVERRRARTMKSKQAPPLALLEASYAREAGGWAA